ncbi:uncharacterized protein C3orf38-like [Sycon ciliatum]|uniref:uncharacterized protein C3orf38-like n=1 Tax=Sycon ciliatum TaxID=27933 RepID=UPI0020A9FFB8|eukprot:scpid55777/ scgid22751/ Uncharacterized protein C3orf38 homolog
MINMLTEEEKREARLLLDKLPTEDIEALTETVSSRMVTAETRESGVEAILLYSESAKQLLRRKKVKREHIVMYLGEKNQQASHTEDKSTLVKRVLDFWEKNGTSHPAGDDGRGGAGLGGAMGEGSTIVDEFMTHGGGYVDLPRTESPTFEDAVGTLRPLQVGITPEGMAVCKDDDGQLLAESFAPWFYGLLKTAGMPLTMPAYAGEDMKLPDFQGQWGPHHFWPDAKLQIFELPDGMETRVSGAVQISTKFAGLVSSGFIFEANFSRQGIKGLQTVRDLISVSVAGKFSQVSDPPTYCSEGGTFEQSFSLQQDRQSMNWRIKSTNLKLMWTISKATNDPEDEQELPFLHATPTADIPLGLPA